MNRILTAYKMRWKRRRLLFRAVRKRRQLVKVADRTPEILPDQTLLFSTVRNEVIRLPYFLEFYRRLGVGHFLFVDNASNDGTGEYLARQPDVSLWNTQESYKLSRFGMDWLTWLQIRYGHGHWCLTVDADELLIFPHWESRGLAGLTRRLDETGCKSFGATLLDLYPRGRLSSQPYSPGQDPLEILQWFDNGNYQFKYQQDLRNLLVRGGVRSRVFFSEDPARAPTLSKTPLVKWNRRYAYVSSTHSLLPVRLNDVRSEKPSRRTSGVLLHTKFLHTVIEKSREDIHRQQHFENGRLFREYYKGLIADPVFWNADSVEYKGWRQLESLGLMSRGGWE